MPIFDQVFTWGGTGKPGSETWFDIRVFYNNDHFHAVAQNPPIFQKSPFPDETEKWATLIFRGLKEGIVKIPEGSIVLPENFSWYESRPNYQFDFKEKFELVELHWSGTEFFSGERRKVPQELLELAVGENLEIEFSLEDIEEMKETARLISEKFKKDKL